MENNIFKAEILVFPFSPKFETNISCYSVNKFSQKIQRKAWQ